MKFLRRKVKGTETVREKGRVVHREIEITVEREWLSVPSQPAGGAESPVVCRACGQFVPCISSHPVTDAASHPYALEEPHAEPNR